MPWQQDIPNIPKQNETKDAALDGQDTTGLGLLRSHNSLQPISRIPNEIISDVLFYASAPPPHAPLTPCKAFQVCHTWWECAMESPHIWATMVFPRSPKLVKYFIEILLPRSKALPISLTAYTLGADLIDDFQRVIREYGPRLRTLSIDLVEMPPTPLFPLSSTFPLLREFAFWLRSGHMSSADGSQGPVIQLFDTGAETDLPALRSLSVKAYHMQFSLGATVHVPQLDQISLSLVDPVYMWGPLLKHNTLRTLEWNISPNAILKISASFDLPDLSSLKIPIHSLATTFLEVDMPSLSHLKILSKTYNATPFAQLPPVNLGAMSGRMTSLKTLTILDPTIQISDSALQHLPSLEEIHLLDGGLKKVTLLFTLLTNGGELQSAPCPYLTKLTLPIVAFPGGTPQWRDPSYASFAEQLETFAVERAALKGAPLVVFAAAIERSESFRLTEVKGSGNVTICFKDDFPGHARAGRRHFG